jgi:hypothetical protein
MLCCAQINVILDSSSDLCPYVGLGSGKIARKTSLFRIKGIVIAGVRYYLFNMSHLLVTKGGLFAWI